MNRGKVKRAMTVGSRSVSTTTWHIPTFVRSVVSRLHRAGHQAYVVGGAVRDLCMGRPAIDWDVTTSASPEQIVSVFKGLRSFSLKHETVTLVYRRRHYEVTTFRGPNQTLQEDLEHRDFTINAMAYDTEKSVVIDPRGGREDIAKRVVRGVVSPEQRFREDPLRLMRAVRIAAELGFRIDGKTLKAISSMAGLINSASPERIRDELIRIVLCEKPSLGLDLLKKTGLLDLILPEFVRTARIKADLPRPMTVCQHILETVDRVKSEEAIRLAALFHGLGGPYFRDHARASLKLTQEIMVRLCFNRKMIRQVAKLVEEARAVAGYQSSWSDGDLRRFIRRVGAEHIEPVIALTRTHLLSLPRASQKPLRQLNEVQTRIRGLIKTPLVKGPQDLAIDGSKVMEVMGLSPGPEVGRILKHLSEELMDHPEWNTRKKLVSRLKKIKPPALPEHSEAIDEIHGTAGRLKTRIQPKS